MGVTQRYRERHSRHVEHKHLSDVLLSALGFLETHIRLGLGVVESSKPAIAVDHPHSLTRKDRRA